MLAGVVALLLLAVALGPHRVGDYYSETDFYGGYAPGAKLLLGGRADPARYGVAGPGIEVALALVGLLTRDPFRAGELISIASGVAALLAWSALLRHRAGAWAGLWTAALLAANVTFFRQGYSVGTDALALGLQAGALWAAFGPRRPAAPFVSGLLLALAALTRYTAVALLPVTLAAHAFEPPAPGRSRRRAIALHAAGFAIPALPFLAWMLTAGHVPGEALFHNVAYDAFAVGRGRTLAQYQLEMQPGLHSLGQVLAADPGALLRREAANALAHVKADARELLGLPVAIACALGLVVALLTGAWRRLWPLWLAGLALYVALVPAPSASRYSLVLAPFYLSLAGAALGSAPALRGPRAWRVPLAALVGAGLLAYSAFACVRAQRTALAQLPVETLAAARALAGEAPHGACVMALKPQVAFHAGAAFAAMPMTDRLDSLAAACRAEGADHLYYSWLEAGNRPAFWYLLDPPAPVPGLRPVVSIARGAAMLYRIEPGFGTPPAWLDSARIRAEAERRFVARMGAPLAWRAHLSLAIWARGRHDFGDCAAQATATLAGQPDLPLALRLLADARLELGDRAGATAGFARLVAVDPENVDARVALGWLELAAGDAGAASAAWAPVAGEVTDRTTLERMQALFAERGEGRAEAAARAAEARLGR